MALKQLQTIDLRIADAEGRIRDFDPLFADVEEPALVLESEVGTTRKRLQEMRLEERRIELSTEEKRARVTRLDERLGSVRNLREEAAVSAELDMVKRALQSDEQEAYTLLDQIRKLDERLQELEAAWTEAKALVEPRIQGLVGQRDGAKAELAALETERESFAATMDPQELRLYEAIRGGGRRLAVSDITADGACGHCYGLVPLQLQNEIRHGTALIRCEVCGVILAAPDPDAEATAPPGPPVEPDPGDGGSVDETDSTQPDAVEEDGAAEEAAAPE
jgi:predicted  nucleic acid-binding Zn-ribbon protein